MEIKINKTTGEVSIIKNYFSPEEDVTVHNQYKFSDELYTKFANFVEVFATNFLIQYQSECNEVLRARYDEKTNSVHLRLTQFVTKNYSLEVLELCKKIKSSEVITGTNTATTLFYEYLLTGILSKPSVLKAFNLANKKL